MTDLQLPKPLLTPSQWAQGPAIFSIDSLRYGGPFLERRVDATFAIPETFWASEHTFAQLLPETLGRLADVHLISRTRLDPGEIEAWRKNVKPQIHFHVDGGLRAPSVLDWSKELFPESVREAGELHWTRVMRDYEKQMGDAMAGPHALRFWPAFLKQQKLFFAETVAREWAHSEAHFSPQNDSRGVGPVVVQNPTLQLVTSANTVEAFWRIDGGIDRKDLTWEEGAVIDELRETPRLLLEALRHELHVKPFPLKTHSSFHLVMESMIERGLLLLRPT